MMRSKRKRANSPMTRSCCAGRLDDEDVIDQHVRRQLAADVDGESHTSRLSVSRPPYAPYCQGNSDSSTEYVLAKVDGDWILPESDDSDSGNTESE